MVGRSENRKSRECKCSYFPEFVIMKDTEYVFWMELYGNIVINCISLNWACGVIQMKKGIMRILVNDPISCIAQSPQSDLWHIACVHTHTHIHMSACLSKGFR